MGYLSFILIPIIGIAMDLFVAYVLARRDGVTVSNSLKETPWWVHVIIICIPVLGITAILTHSEKE